jgi:MFS family permease
MRDSSTAEPTVDRRSWYMLSILILVYIMGSVDRAVPSVVVEPLKLEFGLSDSQIGLLTGFAYSVPYALAALPGGWLLDRLDRRRFLAFTTVVWSILTMAGATAQNFVVLLLARMGVGASEAPASPGSLSLISDLFPRERRGTAVSFYYAGTAVGQLITFMVGGWLLMHFGWRSLFLIAGIPGLILAALLIFTCKEPERGRFDPLSADGPRQAISYPEAARWILRSRPLLHSIWGNMLSTGVQFSVMVWTVSFLVRVHGQTPEKAAIWVGLGIGLMQTLGSLVAGPLCDRFSRGESSRLALVPATFTVLASMTGIAMCLAPTLTGALVMMAIFAVLVGGVVGPGYATLVSLTEPHMRGSVLSIAKLFSILIGNGVLSFMTGKLSDMIGTPDSIRWALAVTLLFHLWAAFHFWRASRAVRRQTAIAANISA